MAESQGSHGQKYGNSFHKSPLHSQHHNTRLASRGGKDQGTNRYASHIKEDASSDDEAAVPPFETLNNDPPEDITGIFDKVHEERKMTGTTSKHPYSNTLHSQGAPKSDQFKKSSCCFPW